MHCGKSCALPSSGTICTVSGESTLQRKGILVKHPMQLVPKKNGSKNLRTAAQLEAYGSSAKPPSRHETYQTREGPDTHPRL